MMTTPEIETRPWAEQIADVFTVLRDGRSVATGQIAAVTNEAIVAHMVGRSVENLFAHHTPRTGGDVVLRGDGCGGGEHQHGSQRGD